MYAKSSDEIEPSHAPGAQTVLGKLFKLLLGNVEEAIQLVGITLMGQLWPRVYATIQDAIAISVLQRVPGFISSQIAGINFQDFDTCITQESFTSVGFYACCVIVSSKISLWVVLGARVARRFFDTFLEQNKSSQEEDLCQ